MYGLPHKFLREFHDKPLRDFRNDMLESFLEESLGKGILDFWISKGMAVQYYRKRFL